MSVAVLKPISQQIYEVIAGNLIKQQNIAYEKARIYSNVDLKLWLNKFWLKYITILNQIVSFVSWHYTLILPSVKLTCGDFPLLG